MNKDTVDFALGSRNTRPVRSRFLALGMLLALMGAALAVAPANAQDMTAHGRWISPQQMVNGAIAKYNWEKMYFGNLYTNNNIQIEEWKDPSDPTKRLSAGWQYMTVKGSLSSSWSAFSEWDWTAGDTRYASLPNYSYSVKAYPSIILGWHWNVWDQTGDSLYYYGNIPSDTGLSLRLWNLTSLNTKGRFSVNRNYAKPSTMNVSFDLWLHTPDKPKPGWGDGPAVEIMVWLTALNGAKPAGGKIASGINIGGRSWNLYKGWINGWYCYSFFPAELDYPNVNGATAADFNYNLKDFLSYLCYNNQAVVAIPDNYFLTSVQLGSEMYNGQGSLTISNYSIVPVRYQQNQ